MKTSDAIRLAGSATALAGVFDITLSAISQWGEEVPQPRYWELRVKRPDWFNADGEVRAELMTGAAQQPSDGVERRASTPS
jgi:hypothetical protein